MTTEEKAAFATAFGLSVAHVPDQITEVTDTSGFRRGATWPATVETEAQRVRRLDEERRALAAIYGVNPAYFELPTEL